MTDDWQLLEDYLDGELAPSEERRLADWLAADRDHVRQFVRETHLHRQIREAMLARAYEATTLATRDQTKAKADHLDVRLLNHSIAQVFGLLCSSPFRKVGMAVFASVAVVVGIWWLSPTVGEPVLGNVQELGLSITRGGAPLRVTTGLRLQSGDVLRTTDKATATITFDPEKTHFIMQPGTKLQLGISSHGKRFALGAGKLEASVARQRPFRPMRVTTPQAEARVLGTRFTVAVTTNATRLDVAEGKVRLTRVSDNNAVQVPAGNYAIVAANYELAALPQTGGLLREWWSGVKGQTMFSLPHDPRFPDRPELRDTAPNFELTVVETNQLGIRLRGYLHPPLTGIYQFWLESGLPDSASMNLMMSQNEDSSEAVLIAINGDPGTSRAPPPVPLVAGKRYYIEARILIPKGGVHFSVAWMPPGGSRKLVTGEFLSPLNLKN